MAFVAFVASACKTWSDALLVEHHHDGGADASDTGPMGIGPLPTSLQVAYQRMELTAFIHFGLQTFDGTENGDSSKDTPALFNPTNLDVDQWMSVLKSAGFRQVMLTAKHSTGFCLWPSAYTDYSVKNSPWKNGQGDLVKDFTDSARAAGMRIGLYLLPWDQHYPSSAPDYETYFQNQLTELLSNYGPIDEIHMEGVLAPTSLNWAGISQLAKKAAAQCPRDAGYGDRHDGSGYQICRQSERSRQSLDRKRRECSKRWTVKRLVPIRSAGFGSKPRLVLAGNRLSHVANDVEDDLFQYGGNEHHIAAECSTGPNRAA